MNLKETAIQTFYLDPKYQQKPAVWLSLLESLELQAFTNCVAAYVQNVRRSVCPVH